MKHQSRDRSELRRLHIAVSSRMVAMGVAVANMALGNIISVYSDEKALRKTVESER